MTHRLRTLLASALLPILLSASAHAASAASDLYVVMFRADWCGPCKIVEPNLASAMSILADPSIEYVNIDISSPSLSEISAHRAFDLEIVPQYNTWLGVNRLCSHY